MVIPIFHSWELPIERRHYEGMSLIEHVFNHPEETLNTALKLPKVEKAAVNDDRRILRDSQRLEILGEIRNRRLYQGSNRTDPKGPPPLDRTLGSHFTPFSSPDPTITQQISRMDIPVFAN